MAERKRLLNKNGYELPRKHLIYNKVPQMPRNRPINPRPIGRPTGFREAYTELAYKLRLLGLTEAEMADIFAVTVGDLVVWRKKVPEFNEAWVKGGQLADANVAKAMYERAIGYEYEVEKVFPSTQHREMERVKVMEHVPGDVMAQKTWLALRDQRRWRQAAEDNPNTPNQPLQPPQIVVRPVQAIQVNIQGHAPTAVVVSTDAEGRVLESEGEN